MKYPRVRDYALQFEIGPQRRLWTLKWVRPRDDRPWVGLCCYDNATIWIELGQTPEKRFETYVHELCHAFAWEARIKFLHHHHYIKKIEKMIPAFLVNNGFLKRLP